MISMTKMFFEPWIVTLVIVVASVLWFVLQARRPKGVRLAVVTRTPIRDNSLFQPVNWTVRRNLASPQQSPSIPHDTIPFPPRPFNPPEAPQPGWMARWTGSSWTESHNFAHLLDPASRPLIIGGQYREPFDDPIFPFGGYRPVTPPPEFPSFPLNPRTEAWVIDLRNPLPPSPPLQTVGVLDSVDSPLQLGGRELLQQPSQGRPMAIPLVAGAPDPFAVSLPSPELSAPSSPSVSIPDVSMQDVPASPVSQSSSQSGGGISILSHDVDSDFAWSV